MCPNRGGQCYSEETCNSRWNYSQSLMSSDSFASSKTGMEGIFDDDPALSSFWGANKVFVAYCTSDGWIGDATPSEDTWGYSFRGQRVIRSALQDLITKLLITNQSEILFAGGSAGARGMMNNIDSLLSLLPAEAHVIGAFLDSPYYIEVDPYTTNFVGFKNQVES